MSKVSIPTFIPTIPPFDKLDQLAFDRMMEEGAYRSYPTREVIYIQEQSPIQGLSIILKGRVEKYFERADGSRSFVEAFKPGDTFGAVSILLNNERAIRSVRTVSKTETLTLSKELFLDLCDHYPAFYDFFTQHFGRRMLHSGYADYLLKRNEPEETFQSADITFSQKIRSLYTSTYNACSPTTSIQAAAQQMVQNRRSYILVENEKGPSGIITDQQIRTSVVAENKSVKDPVTDIMMGPLQEIDIEAYSYEAILKMFRCQTNYLLVKEKGKLKGMVSLGKLLNAQGKSPFIFVRSLWFDEDLASLKRKWQQVPLMVDNLIERGMRPEIVNQIVTAISDAISSNIVSRALKTLGPAPVPFVFIALGSEGRKEQTLRTDQDNALIYQDLTPEKPLDVKNYFLELGRMVSRDLNEIGFDFCKGKLMASNPQWNQPLGTWKTYYKDWIHKPAAKEAMIASAFFDCRAIYGESALLDELRSHIFEQLGKGAKGFLTLLTHESLANRPPLGWFGWLQETKKEDKKGIQIKRAMQTITDFARIYALQEKINATNTGDRLRLLRQAQILQDGEFRELHQAYYFMMRLRLTHQTQQILSHQAPDNLVPVDEMSKIEQVTLKEIFKVVEKYQRRLSIVFMGMLTY
ncbi:MAG: DUF294 nucleotidyltransferase-like domain-containing protein [Bacteroidota bacterium]